MAGGELVGQSVRDFGLVVFVIGEERAVQSDSGQQSAGGASVFASDDVHSPENGAGPFGNIGEVPDRRGDDVEVSRLRNERGVFHRRGAMERGRLASGHKKTVPRRDGFKAEGPVTTQRPLG
jgi:hypothetical protein